MAQHGFMPTQREPGWRIEMLGGLRAVATAPTGSGDPYRARVVVERFRTHKAALLLARLALSPQRSHAREELADLLWPDAPAERARAMLTQALGFLRQAFGEPRGGLFVSDHRTVRVDQGLMQTDVAEWETAASQALAASCSEQARLLQAACAGYRGDLLPGFYDEWVCDERNRLTALHSALEERLQNLSAQAICVQPPQPKALFFPPAQGEKATMLVNAPLLLTRFFGREAEFDDACRRLRQEPPVRLLTLRGMGGIGKTRLALQIAHAVLREGTEDREGLETMPFGFAAFVPLVEARTRSQMESVLGQVLARQSGGSHELADVLICLQGHASRTEGRLLLILDNLEQLGECAALVVNCLLTEVPALTLLVTSRQPVGVIGEQEMPIGSLRRTTEGAEEAIPDDVRLFADRAQLVRPDLALTPENASVIGHLCTLLEGIPLALELAAAWARVMTPAQIVERLRKRFDLLTLRGVSTVSGNIAERHQSLQAAISWSYDLLEPSLRAFFVRLSVFRGGWTVEAAAAVAEAGDASHALFQLVERSLILVEEVTAGDERKTRYRMLESLREFAEAKLSPGERSRLLRQHACFFDTLSGRADQRKRSGNTQEARRLLSAERDNLQAAIVSGLHSDPADHSIDAADHSHGVHGFRILIQSDWLWSVAESEPMLALAGDTLPLLSPQERRALEGPLLMLRGERALYRGDYEGARQFLCLSLALVEEADDRRGCIRAKTLLGSIAGRLQDPAKAVALWKECLADARHLKDEPCQANLLNNLATIGGDFSGGLTARQAFIAEAVSLDRVHSPGSHLLACSLNTMASIASEAGDYPSAQVCLEEAHELVCADSATGMKGVVQMSLGEILLQTGGSLDRARDLFCAAQNLFEECGEPPRVAQAIYLRFRLALVQHDAGEALACARQYLRLPCQNRSEAVWRVHDRESLTDELQKAGFEDYAEHLK